MIKKSMYRQRVYRKAEDGSIELVFGNDMVDETGLTLLADHDITDIVEVVDHVEPPVA